MNQPPPARFLTLIVLFAAAYLTDASRSDDQAKAVKPAAGSMLGKGYGQLRDDNWLKMKLVWCPPGAVTMEQVESDEGPGKKITPLKVLLTRGYWLGKYEVTQAEWMQVMETTPWRGQRVKEGEDFPAMNIEWRNAMRFCRQLTDHEREAGRLRDDWEYTLPTEAQWERACRARTETRYSFGHDASELGDYAWYGANASDAAEPYPHRVGLKKPNPWGLHDMHGNLFEWCRDYYAERLPGGVDPELAHTVKPLNGSGPEGGDNSAPPSRVIRGGCWAYEADRCFSGYREGFFETEHSSFGVGFRVALSRVQQTK